MDVHADNPPCFRYGQTELDHLRARDPRLAAASDRLGLIQRAFQPMILRLHLTTRHVGHPFAFCRDCQFPEASPATLPVQPFNRCA